MNSSLVQTHSFLLRTLEDKELWLSFHFPDEENETPELSNVAGLMVVIRKYSVSFSLWAEKDFLFNESRKLGKA